MSEIIAVHGREILDSRGNPTVEAEVLLEDGSLGRASVPSGASTGKLEALELRDGDKARYNGKGVLKAVEAINEEIADNIIGTSALEQQILDQALIDLDATPDKSRLGANSLLAVSLAAAKAGAMSSNLPLYRFIGGMGSHLLPVPMMNIINGGAHADNDIDIQEFMIMPVAAGSISEAVRVGAEIFHTLKTSLKQAGFNTNIGDEGGFAPDFKTAEQALDFIMKATEQAGFKPGKEVYIALDAASSEFYHDGIYDLKGAGQKFTASQLIAFYTQLIANYPILSIEDAMAEGDHQGWQEITTALSDKVQLVGDDLFVTNPAILRQGIKDKLANSVLIKPNQIGTLSETIETIDIAKSAGYNTILSHRSGETEDTTIAHIAVAKASGQIKTGSLCRSDRMAKYNELIRIEQDLTFAATYAGLAPFAKYI